MKGLMKNRITESRRGIFLAALLGGCLYGTVHAQTNSAASPTPSTAKPTMHSRVFQWNDLRARPTDVATFRDVFDAPTATLDGFSCHVTTLYPGKEPHPAHQHPEEELLIIKEGTLEVVQNGVTNQVSAGGMV